MRVYEQGRKARGRGKEEGERRERRKGRGRGRDNLAGLGDEHQRKSRSGRRISDGCREGGNRETTSTTRERVKRAAMDGNETDIQTRRISHTHTQTPDELGWCWKRRR